MTYKSIANRPNATTDRVKNWIANRHCWHFDAWLMRDSFGVLYFVYQTSAGGSNVLARAAYMVNDGALIPAPVPEGTTLLMLDPGALGQPLYHALNAIHWRETYQRSLAVAPGYKRRSVAFHYIAARSLDPLEGVSNMYAFTGRADRDNAFRQARTVPASNVLSGLL